MNHISESPFQAVDLFQTVPDYVPKPSLGVSNDKIRTKNCL